jgi:septum site-determining protein MinC
MSPDSIDDEPGSNPIQFVSLVNFDPQITLENDGKILFLHLPTEAETESLEDISFLWQELKYRLQSSEKTWLPGTAAYLVARDRLLDSRQLQTIAELLDELELDL